jgi:hypothetical protein
MVVVMPNGATSACSDSIQPSRPNFDAAYAVPNSKPERLIGTIRRECLDFVIPLNERHVRRVLAEWVRHYNRGRPHASPGPGISDPVDGWLAPSFGGHGSKMARLSRPNRSSAACTTSIVLSQ